MPKTLTNLLLSLTAAVATTLPALAQKTQNRAFGALLDTMISREVPTVTCNELKRMQNVVLLDARERPEYDVSHLPGAHWVGYDDFDLKRVQHLPKDANVVLYCSVGYRSGKVGEKLLAAGFRRVQNLYGSLFEWVNQGNPVVDAREKPTQRVHAFSPVWGVWLKRGEKVYK